MFLFITKIQFLVLSISMPLSFAQTYSKLFEEIDLEPTLLSSKHQRLELAKLALARIQSDVIGELDLDRMCFVGYCGYSYVTKFLSHPDDVTLYWTLLNCVKHGIGCGDDSHWMDWMAWSDCSARCGQGVQTRRRHCYISQWGLNKCLGSWGELKTCTHQDKLFCMASPSEPDEWGSWGSWGSCDRRCGSHGVVKRTRLCMPSGYAMYCLGSDEENRVCIDIPGCPTNGKWSDWSSWSKCTAKTCLRSFGYRSRTCSNRTPINGGRKCQGSSVEVKPCPGPPCKYIPPDDVMRFIPSSSLVYRPHPTWSYLSIVIKFRPVSVDGLLLRHTGKSKVKTPRTSKKVKVTVNNPNDNDQGNLTEEYVTISLDKRELLVSVLLNDSDPVVIHAGKVKLLQWNVVRLLIVSDVINVRFNDGENMKATLQDSPVRPDFLHVTHDKDKKKWWGNLWKKGDVEHPDAPKETITQSTRAILASFTGSISLGKYKNHLGFRGYISLLLVNFVSYEFETQSLSQISKQQIPIVSEDVETIPYGSLNMYEEVQLPHFDGRQRLYVPLAMRWWDDGKSGKTENELFKIAANLKITFKPETADAVLLWNQGKNDFASQWKVVIEDGLRVKFISTQFGGNVFVATSYDAVVLGDWNMLDLLLFGNGAVHFRLNSNRLIRSRVPRLTKPTEPGPVIVVGGSRKFGQFYKNPSTAEEAHTAPFHGYIYSLKQNEIEFMVHGRNFSNAWRMPLSDILNQPIFNEFWYFKPLYQEDPSSAAGLISRTLQFLRIKKVPLRKLIGGEKPLTLADIHERGNVREMACVIPVSVDILHVPTIMWYKDGVPIYDGDHYLIRSVATTSSVRSSVFLLPAAEGSKEQSGVYSCMVEDRGTTWVFINHVAAVINNNIANPNSLLTSVLIYIREGTGATETQSMFIASGMATGFATLLLLVCLLQRRYRTSRRKRGGGGKKKKKPTKKVKEKAGGDGANEDRMLLQEGGDVDEKKVEDVKEPDEDHTEQSRNIEDYDETDVLLEKENQATILSSSQSSKSATASEKTRTRNKDRTLNIRRESSKSSRRLDKWNDAASRKAKYYDKQYDYY